MPFIGGPLERDSAGFWFGLSIPGAKRTEFRPKDDAVKNAMQGFVGKMVKMEGIIIEKRPAPDYGPAVVKVFSISLAPTTGYIPPNVEIPTLPPNGIALNDKVGIWTFYSNVATPSEMFKFSWQEGTETKSVFVVFDPQNLQKTPDFRYNDPNNGRDLWESHGHTVHLWGFLAPDKPYLFITKFLDESTVWPRPDDPFTTPAPPPNGTTITDQSGVWRFDTKAIEPKFMYKFKWTIRILSIKRRHFDLKTKITVMTCGNRLRTPLRLPVS